MKKTRVSPHGRERRTNAARRAQLLAAFNGSGLSAAVFARQQGIHYTTFCGWRKRQAQGKPSPGFVQVEMPEPTPPVELVIELGRTARLRLTSEAQIPLAAHLLQTLKVSRPC
jgi:hypothetical protein